jgi:hypothetical protein
MSRSIVAVRVVTARQAVDSFLMSCKVEGKSYGTIECYTDKLKGFLWYATTYHWPRDIKAVTADHLREFLVYLRVVSCAGHLAVPVSRCVDSNQGCVPQADRRVSPRLISSSWVLEHDPGGNGVTQLGARLGNTQDGPTDIPGDTSPNVWLCQTNRRAIGANCRVSWQRPTVIQKKGMANSSRIFEHAAKTLGGRLEEDGQVPPRVLRGIL